MAAMGDTKRTREEKGSGKEEQMIEETIERELESEDEGPERLEDLEDEDADLDLEPE